MLQANVNAFSKHKIKNIYDVIIDVNAYKDFLPYCLESNVISFEKDTMIADLTIGIGFYKKKYRSKVLCNPPSNGRATISITMIEGPLKHLDAIWTLYDRTTFTEMKFQISLEFKMNIFNKLLASRMQSICDTIMHAFEKKTFFYPRRSSALRQILSKGSLRKKQ